MTDDWSLKASGAQKSSSEASAFFIVVALSMPGQQGTLICLFVWFGFGSWERVSLFLSGRLMAVLLNPMDLYVWQIQGTFKQSCHIFEILLKCSSATVLK